MKLKTLFTSVIAALGAFSAVSAQADINVGVIASLTGPAAALGAETRKAVAMFPTSIGSEKVNYILLDDATDPTSAVKNVRKLIGEDKVDAILGPNLISTATAIGTKICQMVSRRICAFVTGLRRRGGLPVG